jgi:hypothetical protein
MADILTVLETEGEEAVAGTGHIVAALGCTVRCDSGVGPVIHTGFVQAAVGAASVHVVHTEGLSDIRPAAVD